MEDNMRQLFPEHDLETAPDGFAKFTKVERTRLGVYEKFDDSQGHDGCGCVYESDGSDGFKEVWYTLPMSEEEKLEKIAIVKKSAFPSWIFHESDCRMRPPVEYPTDGKEYRWNEEIINWIEIEG
jgi:hypothetical protein